jgi:hypothetical protein
MGGTGAPETASPMNGGSNGNHEEGKGNKEEILEIAKLAKFIKEKAASHVDRRITALEQGITSLEATLGMAS